MEAALAELEQVQAEKNTEAEKEQVRVSMDTLECPVGKHMRLSAVPSSRKREER